MTLKYKYLSIITTIIIIIFLLVKRKNSSNKYKVTNIDLLKESTYFQKKIIIYKFIKIVINILLVISLMSAIILLGRPSIIKKHTNKKDIQLCIDVSSSTDKLNIEKIKELKKINNYYKDERLGITIFNTSAITLSPLTYDHDYINNILNKIEESIKANIISSNDVYLKNYIISGTLENHERRNKSLIGDGIISCTNNLNNNDSDKYLILLTDYKTQGHELFTQGEAIKIVKKQNIKLLSMKNNNSKDIINIMKNTKTKNIKTSKDYPTIIYIILFTTTTLLLIIKKVYI